jgi:dephospho-CoA kinase
VTIRVTGGIGSGKSVLCSALADLGATVFNADSWAKKLMSEDQRLRAQIQNEFGVDSYSPDGKLNRKYLADRVFSDDLSLRALNAIVHPAVFRAFDEVVTEARSEGVRYLVYEAALLTNRGNDHSSFDLTVVVDSERTDRIARVRRRDNSDEEHVLTRMDKQPSRQAYLDVADYVVINNASVSELQAKAAILLQSIEENFIPGKEMVLKGQSN